jgi:hypothetical protein
MSAQHAADSQSTTPQECIEAMRAPGKIAKAKPDMQSVAKSMDALAKAFGEATEAAWRAARTQQLLSESLERFEAMAQVREEAKSQP